MSKLERRVVTTAERALANRHYVSPLDLLAGLGWGPPGFMTDWRQSTASGSGRGDVA